MPDMISHPPHYTNREHECIDEMVAMFGIPDVISFCKCNAWKYRYRAGSKGDREDDLKKSDWYISKAIELQDKQYVSQEVEKRRYRQFAVKTMTAMMQGEPT